MSGGAIIARQNRYMHAFKIAGATSKETAKTLKEIGIVPIGIFRRMEITGVFEKCDGNRYFMNQEKANQFIERRSRYGRLVLAVFGIVLLILYLSFGRF